MFGGAPLYSEARQSVRCGAVFSESHRSIRRAAVVFGGAPLYTEARRCSGSAAVVLGEPLGCSETLRSTRRRFIVLGAAKRVPVSHREGLSPDWLSGSSSRRGRGCGRLGEEGVDDGDVSDPLPVIEILGP